MARLKNYLEVATSIAVVLVAVVVLTTLVRGFFNQDQKPQPQAGLQKGQQLSRLPAGINGKGSQTTLLVAMSTTCHYCAESVPFYNQLEETLQKASASTAIVAIFPNPENQVREYAGREQLKMATIAAIDLNSLNVHATPTMILIDRSGKILDFWVGKLSKDEEQQVIKAVGLNKT